MKKTWLCMECDSLNVVLDAHVRWDTILGDWVVVHVRPYDESATYCQDCEGVDTAVFTYFHEGTADERIE